jgi:thiol-disulfide isomerase/thioredoxin
MRHFLWLLCSAAAFVLLATNTLLAAPLSQDLTVTVADQDLQINRFPAKGDHLVLWISPSAGLPEREAAFATALARRGVEVWYIDILDSLFLPRSSSTMRALDGRYVAGLISAAHEKTGKQVVLLTRGYACLPTLRGARLWQKYFFEGKAAHKSRYLSGAILISPELHSRTTDLGLEPVYAPIASATNIPIMIYQSGKRGNRWQLEKTMEHLESGGAQVYLKILPGVTGLFYKDDTAQATQAALATLPNELHSVIKSLDKMPMPDKILPIKKPVSPVHGGRDIRLAPYHGDPVPQPLNLKTLQGKRFIQTNYHGKVTLVNFWASWCGPCVKEIPSLNNLRKKMHGKPFQLISVNYAEDKQHVSDFMKKVEVNYPVLLDTDGLVAKQWGVSVFPATFVIGPDGKIKYGVSGGLYWDSPEVIQKLDHLINQTH